MKVTVFIIVFASIQTFALNNYAQTKRMDVKIEQSSIVSALEKIEYQSEFSFFYNNKVVKLDKKISVDLKDKTINEILDALFKDTDIEYTITNRQIVLSGKETGNLISQQQKKSVSGKVTDSSGGSLPGVSVVVKGTTTGVITDISGNYSLSNIPENATLQFSFVGMKTQEIVLGGKSSLNVMLAEEAIGLEEVVAIGYGKMKKSDLTGSVSSISQEKMKNLPISSIDQKMIGQVAGVQIQQISGAPGGGTSVKIRGNGSIGAGNEPLYVVDGMPYSMGMNQDMNPLVFLNPNDIESIDILKDASSTAIYGSRGANGVVMITTKKGSFDHTEVNLSSMYGIQQVPQKGRPQMMNQREFAQLQRDKIDLLIPKNENRQAVLTDYPIEYRDLDKLTAAGYGTNWYDLILQTAIVQDHNISVSKGTKDSRLNFSLGYYNQEGALRYTGLERYTGKLSMESNIGKVVKIGASLQPTFISQNRTNTNTSRDDIIGRALWGNPIMPAYDANGELIPYIQSPKSKYQTAFSFPNPLFSLRETIESEKDFQNLGIAFIEWEIIPSLVAKSSLNTIYSTNKYNQYIPSTIGGNNAPPMTATGRSNNERGSSINWLIENTLTYNKTIKKNRLSTLLGYTVQNNKADNISIGAYPYSNDLIKTINAAQTLNTWGQTINEWSMISYLGRINYSYNERYLFTATFRSDGSSRFGEKNRFAFFPSMAAAWRINEEQFMKNVKMVDNLKLRVSYGKSGNDNIGNYASLPSINAGSYIFGNTQVTGSCVGISNPLLTWEESDQIDAGLDIGLFKNRLSLVVDYYYRKSQNMLLLDIIPAITGFNSQIVNKGNVRNTGVEIALSGTPVAGAFTWDVNLNLSFNRNKVLSLNDNGDRILSGNNDGNPTNVTVVGKPIGQLFGYVFERLYTAADMLDPKVPKHPTDYEGANKYTDINGDGVITDVLDYTIIGNPQPDFIFALNNSFSYKNFDLSINLNGQYGGDVVNGLRSTIGNTGGGFNLTKEWVNRWVSPTQPGDGKHYGTSIFAPSYGHRVSNLWIQDATYLRISNLTLAYTIPKQLMKASGFINSCKLNMSIHNLAMFTSYDGGNPEGQSKLQSNVLSPGFDMSSYPLARTVSFGVNLSF